MNNDTAWNTVHVATSCVQTSYGDEFRWYVTDAVEHNTLSELNGLS